MKLQYLGDSKDSFKWDYHDYLTNGLGFPFLNICFMMTPDDETNDGRTSPTRFPARTEIIDLCKTLKDCRNLNLIHELPGRTRAGYAVKLHKPNIYITPQNRLPYFSGVTAERDQVVFLDPDNGFEPQKNANEKHVLYSEVNTLLKQISDNSIISVFQHFRRVSFPKDFENIKRRLSGDYVTAIYWHSLMFVCISKSEDAIRKVSKINNDYSKKYPVNIIDSI